MIKFDFLTPFYKRTHSPDTLIKEIDSLLGQDVQSVRAIPFYCDKQPKELFSKYSSKTIKVNLVNENKQNQLFQLNILDPSIEKDKISGYFFVYEHLEFKNVYVILTIESSEFYNKYLYPLLKKLYPSIVMTFISHRKLRHILEAFQIKNQLSHINITRASHQFRLEEEGKQRKVIPMISWPDMELKEAFQWIYENNGWFKSLQFEAKRNSITCALVSLTRQGIVKTDRMFEKVFESFTLPVCKTIHDNIEIFRNRSRRENSNFEAKPLAIDFETEQFSDISENEKFIVAMKRLKTASISVLHGNPYIYLSIIDYLDGSSFDIWVLDSNKLVIVPQMKGSIPAIKRLINHIFDNYAEGRIRDYSEVING